jgi:hypothetical protein
VRGFVVGCLLLVVVSLTLLSFRRGGLRRQLRFAARRFRLALALAAVYLVFSAVVRLAFPEGAVADLGPPILAVVLVAVFVVFGQDPVPPAEPARPR